MKAIIFSKDRPLQLDGCLRSFYRHCLDPHRVNVTVLVKAAPQDAALYARVALDWPQVNFIQERDFSADLAGWLAGSTHVLFTVDDCVYWRDFELAPCLTVLDDPQVIGISLLLGRNITYSYNFNRSVKQPPFEDTGAGLLRWAWPGSDETFGYPLQVSAGVFRTADLWPFIAAAGSPNSLEGSMANRLGDYYHMPLLVSPAVSVAYDVQVNRVQESHPNLVGHDARYSVAALRAAYIAGWRLDVEQLPGTGAVQQEIELPLVQIKEPM